MRKTIFTCLVAFMGLLAFSTAQATVSHTAYDPTVHKGILCVGIDDYMDATQLDTLDAVGLPVTFFIYEDEAEANATRIAATNRAINTGYDIQAHTTSVGIDTLTAAEIRTMFSEAKEYVTSKRRMRSDWSATPVGFTYFGNAWTEESQSILTDYFSVGRIRYYSSDTPTVRAYPYAPDVSPQWKSDRGLPLAQMDLSRLTYPTANTVCDSCGTGTASEDTTGMADFLEGLSDDRAISVTSFHKQNYDISNHQMATLLRTADARGDIWIATIQQVWDEFGDSHAHEDWGVVYCDAQGDSSAKGTSDDPIAFEWALNYTWGQTLQLADETYDLPSMFGVEAADPSFDLTFTNSMTIRGPATWDFGEVYTDNTRFGAIVLLDPENDTWLEDYRLRLVNIDMSSDVSTTYGGSILYIYTRNVEIDSCNVTQGSNMAFRLNNDNAHRVRCTNSTFTQTSNSPNGCFTKTSSGSDSSSFIGNIVTNESASGSIRGGFYAQNVECVGDSIMNNVFINDAVSPTSYYAVGLTKVGSSGYDVFFGGNLVSTGNTDVVINLDGADFTWATGVDSLTNVHGLGKNFVTPSSSISDTLRFGGYKLSGWATGANHASIGPVQYTANPFVGSKLPFSRQSYAMLEGPWDLLQLIDNGVLSASDSLDTDTWYPIVIGETPQEQAQYQLFIDAYNAWPEANRQKIRWSVE